MLPRPDSSASLKDKVDSVEYKKIVDQLWGKEDVVSGKRSVGKGTLYWGDVIGGGFASSRYSSGYGYCKREYSDR